MTKHIIIDGQGDPCPRCHRPTQIREHTEITERELRQASYYTRWFCCMNPNCQTKEIMPRRFRVWNDNKRQQRYDAADDFNRSIDACYAAVKERIARGGPQWEPKDPSVSHVADDDIAWGPWREIPASSFAGTALGSGIAQSRL